MTRIGWVGTGVMGASMCRHVMEAGYEVTLTSRTRSKATHNGSRPPAAAPSWASFR